MKESCFWGHDFQEQSLQFVIFFQDFQKHSFGSKLPTIFSFQDDVREAFRRCGDIKVQLIKDRDSGESRGFGFITFSDASKAEEAVWAVWGDVDVRICGFWMRLTFETD